MKWQTNFIVWIMIIRAGITQIPDYSAFNCIKDFLYLLDDSGRSGSTVPNGDSEQSGLALQLFPIRNNCNVEPDWPEWPDQLMKRLYTIRCRLAEPICHFLHTNPGFAGFFLKVLITISEKIFIWHFRWFGLVEPPTYRRIIRENTNLITARVHWLGNILFNQTRHNANVCQAYMAINISTHLFNVLLRAI